MEKINCDTILNTLQTLVETKQVLDASRWVDAAQSLNMLLGEEHDKLFELQQKVAQEKVARIEETNVSVAQAKLQVESLDIYREMCQQKAKIERVIEFIRISKIQARLKNDELHSY